MIHKPTFYNLVTNINILAQIQHKIYSLFHAKQTLPILESLIRSCGCSASGDVLFRFISNNCP